MQQPRPDNPEFGRWLRRTMTREDFEALPADDVEALRRFGVRKSLPAGARLFRQGDRPEAIFIIENGEVELAYEARYERLTVMILRDGSSLGDLPVMLGTPYSYTAVTRTPTTALRFSTQTIETLVEIHPHICFRWLRLVSGRLERAQRRLVELAGKTAFEQVVHFLLHEVDERNSPTVQLTQGEVAATLGIGRQTVSRVLAQLDRQGVVNRARGRIEIRSVDRLRDHVRH
jgi:CRP/FNR family transcriptional regulator